MTTSTNERAIASANPEAIAPGSAWYETLALPTMYVYGSIPYLIMPTMHPGIAHVLSEKDRILNGEAPADPANALRRMVNTYEMVAGIVYAGDEAADIAHGLHELHRPISGEFESGQKYHAWNAGMWTWTWACIMQAGFDVHRTLHGDNPPKGWTSYKEFEEAAYQGGVELGRTFGVVQLPATYPEFLAYHRQIVTEELTDNPQARTIVRLASQFPRPQQVPAVLAPLWTLATLPVARIIRVGMLAGVPDEAHHLVGLRRTRLDRVELVLHQMVWRTIPRSLSSRFAPTYFNARRRWGNPAWRNIYSRDRLAEAKSVA